MKILIGLGHPAHFHLFKNVIQILSKKGHEFIIVISDKDVLKTLVDKFDFEYYTIAKKSTKESLFNKANKIIKSTIKLNKIVKKENPDILIGSLTQIAFSGFIKRKPSYIFGEDDINYTYLQVFSIGLFINKWVAPEITRTGIFSFKKLAYAGYQKLAYLHPNMFQPNPELIKGKIDSESDYFLIRLVGLGAYHDQRIKGVSSDIIRKLITILLPHGKIYISSESPLPEDLQKYKLQTNPELIHHVLAGAKIFIGDSQSMTVEAAMLGIPSIRFNDFAGKINLIEELEKKYKLTYSIPTSRPEELYQTLESLLANINTRMIFQQRREAMLSDKIDVTAFFCWLLENYPKSISDHKNDPSIQHQFK